MKEALKLALEALQKTQSEGYNLPATAIEEAITAIKAALAQEQEPVALLLLQSKQNFERNFNPCWQADWIYSDLVELLDTTPPQPEHETVTYKSSVAHMFGDKR